MFLRFLIHLMLTDDPLWTCEEYSENANTNARKPANEGEQYTHDKHNVQRPSGNTPKVPN